MGRKKTSTASVGPVCLFASIAAAHLFLCADRFHTRRQNSEHSEHKLTETKTNAPTLEQALQRRAFRVHCCKRNNCFD